MDWPRTWTILSFGYYAVAVVTTLLILRRPRKPQAMLAWILAVLLLPGVGLLLFVMMSEPRRGWHQRRRRRKRKKLRASSALKSDARDEYLATSSAPQDHVGVARLMNLARRLGAYPPTPGNDVIIYHDAEKTFLAIQMAIEAAQSHIHLEYYILQADDTGRAVRDLLIDRAKQGVRCRVLLDYVGCWRLSRRFIKPMRAAGVQVAFALPVIPWRGRWRVNYRNHRKIAIIDGRIGFTGSQNIGDEYLGRLKKFGPWRDTHLKIVGPAVQDLQEVFIEDWHYTTKELLAGDDYYPSSTAAGEHVAQIVPSGPDQVANVMHQLLFAAVAAAGSSISVITPYFSPDEAMILALASASYRGVRVRLIVPSCGDHRVVLWAGRSYYEELTRSGVEIYEHDGAMLHSKVMIVDQAWAMVGSANMDERSFRINFELTTLLYDSNLAGDLHRDFEGLRRQSRTITRQDVANRSFGESILLGLARLASPVL
ncbi:MAG: cardiolipin synthase [Phycisphaerae bacterium]|nr:cardiolipin synthase [Phycisphaerae bacterium]